MEKSQKNLIKVVFNDNFVELYSDFWEKSEKLTFNEKKSLIKEFNNIKKNLKHDYKGWVCYTKNDKPQTMRVFRRLGAEPYRYDIGTDCVWFYGRF